MESVRVDFERSLRVPLAEVSGLTVQRDGEDLWLLAVGDSAPVVARAPLTDGRPGEWELISLQGLARGEGLRQLEAIAADADGRVVVVGEEPAIVTILDLASRSATSSHALDVSDFKPLARAWEDENSRAEGLLLMRSGHLLIAKEKRPAALIEFGPSGDRPLGVSRDSLLGSRDAYEPPDCDTLVALAWWPLLEGLDDVSDLEIDAEGQLYLLSDRSHALARARLPLAPEGEGLRLDAMWNLGKQGAKAEGIAFVPTGELIVAVDRPNEGKSLGVVAALD